MTVMKEKINKAFGIVVKGQTEEIIKYVQYKMDDFLKMSGIPGELKVTASVEFKWEHVIKES